MASSDKTLRIKLSTAADKNDKMKQVYRSED